jgi:hypothetical protein
MHTAITSHRQHAHARLPLLPSWSFSNHEKVQQQQQQQQPMM